MTESRKDKRITFLPGAVLIAGLCLLLASLAPQSARAAAEPGVVTVNSTLFSAINVDLEDDLGVPTLSVKGQPPGTKGWPLREIIEYAQAQSGNAFDIKSFVKDPRVTRTNGGYLPVSRFQVADSRYDKSLPIYFLDENGNTAMRESIGTVNTYLNTNPQVSVSKSSVSLDVKITSPSGPVTLKAGQKQTFRAKVINPSGASVTLTWKLGGKVKQSGDQATQGSFSYEFRDEGSFDVQVFATATGAPMDADGVTVTVGKAPKKDKPKKDKPKKNDDQGGTPDDNYYDPGYVPGYNDPYGGDTGSGGPSAGNPPPSSPGPEKNRQNKPSADPSGETVSGELIDPSSIATVVPSTDTPSPEATEEADPADDGSGGGGIPTGVKTAFGIGALLGLGGLAEAGAFAGRLRRFRFWP